MTVPRRTLTVTFERSITAGIPNTMEIVVIPLSEPDAPELNVSLVGGPQSQTVVLANAANHVTFELVPTDSPFLDQRVIYRIGWRERFLGRQYTYDFAMPDADVNFADLDDLEAILVGTTYVQWSDRGQPNGVAGLNSLGQVVDADNNPIAADGPSLAQAVTASQGVQRVTVTDPDDGAVSYDFRLTPGVAGRKWAGLVIPASGNFGVIDHGLGTTDVVVTVYRVSDRMPMSVTARPNADGDTVAIEFPSPPVTGQYRAVVIG